MSKNQKKRKNKKIDTCYTKISHSTHSRVAFLISTINVFLLEKKQKRVGLLVAKILLEFVRARKNFSL